MSHKESEMETHLEKMYKPGEVAAMFGVTQATVRIWLNEKTLRGVKIGRGYYWRIPESAVKELATKLYGGDATNEA